jgi:hypothetical protein
MSVCISSFAQGGNVGGSGKLFRPTRSALNVVNQVQLPNAGAAGQAAN